MGFFWGEHRKINLFAADCMKKLNESAANFGIIIAKKNITNEDLMKYGDIAIDVFIKQDPSLYGGIDEYIEDAFYFTITMGIVLAARLRYDTLTHEYVVKSINKSPAEVGATYLKLLGLENFDHPFYQSMFREFSSLYSAHKNTDSEREYLKRELLVLYAIGNTIALE